MGIFNNVVKNVVDTAKYVAKSEINDTIEEGIFENITKKIFEFPDNFENDTQNPDKKRNIENGIIFKQNEFAIINHKCKIIFRCDPSFAKNGFYSININEVDILKIENFGDKGNILYANPEAIVEMSLTDKDGKYVLKNVPYKEAVSYRNEDI